VRTGSLHGEMTKQLSYIALDLQLEASREVHLVELPRCNQFEGRPDAISVS
jgi:hypothetical protein